MTFTVVKGNGRLDGQEKLVRVTSNDGIARAVLTLGPDPGISNNVVNASFEGLLGLPATFTSSGIAPGDPANTRFSGVVLDNGHTPIPGALVSIDGTNLQATTDQNGQFLLTNVPVGHIHLHVDPTNSPRPETFPELAFVTVTIAGQNNILGQPILIPALDMENSKIVGGNQDVTLTMRGVPGLAMTIFANSVQCPGGAPTCRVTISQVHLDKVPMPPPNGSLFMPPAWTIQPHGVHFTKPARMTIPNNGLAPGRIIAMFQFDHDLNMFVNFGKGTVSQDGLTITSDPGFGITAAGWGGGGPPPPPTTQPENNPCQNAADDARKIADNSSDNTSLFAENQACIAEQACQAKMEKPDWLNKVLPDFIKKWGDQTGDWPAVLEKCKNLGVFFPKLRCADLMAQYHIQTDLSDTLKRIGCGTDEDFKNIGEIVKACSDKNIAFPFNLIAKSAVDRMRTEIRANCKAYRLKNKLPLD